METQKSNILIWATIATEKKTSYFLDVCDCFNFEHFPVFAQTKEELMDRKSYYDKLDQHKVYGKFVVESGIAKEII